MDNWGLCTWGQYRELLGQKEEEEEEELLALLLDPGQRSCKENCKESTRRQRSWEEKLLELLGRHLQDQEESQEAILEYLLEVSVMNLTGAQGRMKEVSVY